MGGRRSGVGRSVTNATEPAAQGTKRDGTVGGVGGVEGIPVSTTPPAQQTPGAMPCGQQDESTLSLWPSVWPVQAAGIVFALATPAYARSGPCRPIASMTSNATKRRFIVDSLLCVGPERAC